MNNPLIAAVLRKLAALRAAGADLAKIAEFEHQLARLGYAEPEPEAVPPVERHAPERVTVADEPAPAPVKRGPGRPRKAAA